MKSFLYLCLITFIGWNISIAQVTYQGPAVGNIASGAVRTTDSFFSTVPIDPPSGEIIRNNVINPTEVFFRDVPTPPEDALFHVEDLNSELVRDGHQTVLLKDFQGNPMGNSIPPDPHMAVGPNHIVTTVNTSFRIYDKAGNLLKDITANSWNNVIHPNPDAFDPQIMYDHYEGRWIMLWDNYNPSNNTAFFLVSVSDDDDPLGTWYLYALPAHTNGNTNAGNWGDYPGIGFDSQAMYILSRQFNFSGSGLFYDKLRIISKSELYASQGGALSWKDIWNISFPYASGNKPDGIRPCVTYGPTTDAYFLHTNRNGGNDVNFYKITDPVTNPVLTGQTFTVPYYYAPPNANQLGGGDPAIASNGSQLMMAPRLYNGHLYVVHAMRSPLHAGYSAIKYMKINTATPAIVEEFSYGTTGFFYLFPALEIDKDGNAAVNFTRSGDTEYAGAFYTTRLANDPPGFEPSTMLKPGAGNYVLTYGGLRNRWGDYHGIYRDPSDQNNFWMLTEYAHATNTWGTWVGKIRLVPFPGTYVFTDNIEELDFQSIELGNSSLTQSITLRNYGEDDLIITNIPAEVGPFLRTTALSFPITLTSYDSLTVTFQFIPQVVGVFEELFPVVSNNTEFTGITLKGRGFVINAAAMNILYASSGSYSNGNIFTIDPFTGVGTPIGASLFSDLKSISIHPVTNVMYGIFTTTAGTELVKVNAEGGDAYKIHDILIGGTTAIPEMFAIFFDVNANLYGVTKSGKIYEISVENGTATLKSETGFLVSSAAINPVTNELWVSLYQPSGTGKDKVYKVDIETGASILVGNTGFNLITQSLVFDGAGELYGTTGNPSQNSNFIKIDTLTAVGTIIGSVEHPHITGLAYYGTQFTSVSDNQTIPVVFDLQQNYPNPFNPSTTISFSLPFTSEIKLVVYNLLGEVVKTLVNNDINAGYHSITWNGDDNSGSYVSSGVYFYELRASSATGEKFTQMRKMILMK